jgi:ABC-2 type transport system ATP-binding protein
VREHPVREESWRLLALALYDAGRQGDPLELAGLAQGHVWHSHERDPGALGAWRTGTGQHRNIGNPPAGAHLLEPTLEDGYLLLLGGDALEEVAA